MVNLSDKEHQELQNALEIAEGTINTVREPLIVLDGNLNVLSASRSFYQTFKVDPKETEGRFIYDLGNKQWDIPKLRELLEGILPKNESFDNYEVAHDFPVIGKRIMLLNARRIPRPPAKMRVILLAMEDITERKGGEIEKLRVSEELFKTLFSEALDGICLADAETGIIIDCNQAMADMVGRDRAELIGKHQSILHPPTGDKTALSPTFKQHLTDKEGKIVETQVITRTGEIKEVGIKANLIHLRGRKMLQGIFRDITARKQMEEKLQEKLEEYKAINDNVVDRELKMIELEKEVNSLLKELNRPEKYKPS